MPYWENRKDSSVVFEYKKALSTKDILGDRTILVPLRRWISLFYSKTFLFYNTPRVKRIDTSFIFYLYLSTTGLNYLFIKGPLVLFHKESPLLVEEEPRRGRPHSLPVPDVCVIGNHYSSVVKKKLTRF